MYYFFAIFWSLLSTWMLYNFGRKLPSVFSGILKHFRLYLSNTSIRIYYWKLKICVWYAYQCKFTRVYIQNTRNIPRYYTLIFYLRNIFTDYVVNDEVKFSLHISSRGCTRFYHFSSKMSFLMGWYAIDCSEFFTVEHKFLNVICCLTFHSKWLPAHWKRFTANLKSLTAIWKSFTALI